MKNLQKAVDISCICHYNINIFDCVQFNFKQYFQENKAMEKYECLKLENQLCFSLYALSREIIRLYKPFLDKYNLTYTQYLTMIVLWEAEKMNIKEIGGRLHLDSGTLTPVIKKLEAMDLISKKRDSSDDRVVIVELTEKGRSLRDEIRDIPELMSCEIGITLQEKDELKEPVERLLSRLIK